MLVFPASYTVLRVPKACLQQKKQIQKKRNSGLIKESLVRSMSPHHLTLLGPVVPRV